MLDKKLIETTIFKIENGENLTFDEKSILIGRFTNKDETTYRVADNGMLIVKAIINLSDKTFLIEWVGEEHEYFKIPHAFIGEPYEVEKKKCEETIVHTHWVRKTK